jgi:hypothetical protein
VIRKMLLLMIMVTTAGLIATQWTDIVRYLKIKQLSAGDGHPENVPATGTHRYGQP